MQLRIRLARSMGGAYFRVLSFGCSPTRIRIWPYVYESILVELLPPNP